MLENTSGTSTSKNNEYWSWSLRFLGKVHNGRMVPALEHTSSKYERLAGKAQDFETTGVVPFSLIDRSTVTHTTSDRLTPVGKKTIKVADPPLVEFKDSGLSGEIKLKHGPVIAVPIGEIGSTENLSIRATIQTVISGPQLTGVELDDSSLITLSPLIDSIPMGRGDVRSRLGHTLNLNSFDSLRPIFYMKQSSSGFILLAELGRKYEDGRIERRILFSIDSTVSHRGQKSPANSKRSISSRQIILVTPAFRVPDGDYYTLRVHQDGDIFGKQPYIEFWIENVPLGIFPLSAGEGFRFSGGASKVGIGYWPRKSEAHPNRKDLFFDGHISDILVDPHGHCGC